MPLNGDGYDLVLLGTADQAPIHVDELQRRLDQASYSAVSAPGFKWRLTNS
jgi:hypothetical protein